MTIVSNENASLRDVFVVIRPSATLGGAREQFASVANQAQAALRNLGMEPSEIVGGWARFADMPSWSWRDTLTTAFNGANALPITGLVQPPADTSLKCILELHLVKGARHNHGLPAEIAWSSSFVYGGAKHIQLMSIAPRPDIGSNANVERLAYDMFERAGRTLGECGFAFSDVVRIWVHVSDIDRNYAAMNRARNRYFREQRLGWLPASTCVEGEPVGVASPVALDLYAISAGTDANLRLDVLHSGAMGEATAYGVAFSRAIRIRQRGFDGVFVSGTASIDAQGRVVSAGDVQAQLDCMFRNVTSLLDKARMGFTDVRSATMYLKHADHLGDYVRAARAHSLTATVPCAVVVTNICRPEWLCEIEVYATRESG